MRRIAVCYLVDRDGRVLLQHRDEHAPQAPDQWGIVGGHVEEGEDFDTAVHRELHEETGLVTGPGSALGDLVLWWEGELACADGPPSHYRVYAAQVDLTDADIELGEGRAIVFVDPDEARGLDLAASNAHLLPRFLASELYRGWAG